jgi:cell division septation protein DedD
MAVGNDTEFTLSTGKLLAIFFVLAAICAAFFSFGFYVGKNSSKEAGNVVLDSATLATASGTSATKPAAGHTQPPPSAQETAPAVTTPDESPATQNSAPEQSETTSNPAPEMATSSSGGYVVQVAAVSKQQDADVLVNALRKKQYPVFVVNNQAGSKLFHVQVGPFAQLKDAEEMRSRLSADGYNAILKK